MDAVLAHRRRLMEMGGLLPSGYTRLEYISNVARYIETNIYGTGTSWEVDVQMDAAPSGWQFVIDKNDYLGYLVGAHSNGYFCLANDPDYYIAPVTTRCKMQISFGFKSVTATFGQTSKTYERSSNTGATNIKIFGFGTTGYIYKGRCYGVKCIAGANFDGIPAQRESDSHKGLYDIENDIFYDLS